MTSEEIRCLIKELGDIRHVLSGADPADKADVYRHLNVQMTYHPAKRTVRVETSLDPHCWGYGLCPEGTLTPQVLPRCNRAVVSVRRRGLGAGPGGGGGFAGVAAVDAAAGGRVGVAGGGGDGIYGVVGGGQQGCRVADAQAMDVFGGGHAQVGVSAAGEGAGGDGCGAGQFGEA